MPAKPAAYGLLLVTGVLAACAQSNGGASSASDSGAPSPNSGQGANQTDSGVSAPTDPPQDAGAPQSTNGGPDAGSSVPPPPAAAVGYTVQTLGPGVTIGGNWKPFTFFGTDPSTVVATQNADGSVSVVGGGNNYGAQLTTASATSAAPYFTGTAFGGGGYFEITMAIGGPASFWSNDIETMAGISAGDMTLSQWPGQATGFGDWIECDFAEFDTTGVYGFAMHNWYGTVGSGDGTSTLNSGSPASPPGAVYTQANKYGFLWVPATATQQGYAKWYFNDAEVGNTITWSQYDASSPPPPSETDGTAYSVLDTRHLALILGGPGVNDAGVESTVESVSVWQASGANNVAH
jgi:hypothetical protein